MPYRALKDAISRQRFRAGLPGNQSRKSPLRLGMSRTPVHEALIRLQEEGLVRILPQARCRRAGAVTRTTCARSMT